MSPPFLAAVLEHSSEAIVVTDRRGRPQWASAGAIGLLNGRAIDAVHPHDRRRVAAAYRSLLGAPGDSRSLTCRVVARPGEWHPAELTIVNRTADPEVDAWVSVVRRPPSGTLLPDGDNHDSLTGLPDRRVLQGRVEEAGAGVAVLFIDLDGFKGVNDTLGHAAGDRLLVSAADRLRRAVRPGDSVIRLGGDEFVVVATDVGRETDGLEIAHRVRAAVNRPLPLAGRIVRLTASIGLALGSGDARALLDEADIAMYRAKRAGGDRCEVFHPGMTGAEAARAEAAGVIRTALDDGGLASVYQPVVDLATGEAVAVSVRLRLRDAEGDLVGAGQFVAAAERSGLMVSVGAGLLDSACEEAAAWGDDGPGGATQVWVPLSARMVHQPRLAALVQSTLELRGVDPGRLLLEVQERVLADAAGAAWGNLADLRALGVRLAVSDFGSGGASLAYLRRARVDALEIDPVFVAGLGHDAGDTEVIRGFVGLGEALGLVTVGVGVEQEEQAALLRDLGCRLGQGFHFGRPAPAAEAPVA